MGLICLPEMVVRTLQASGQNQVTAIQSTMLQSRAKMWPLLSPVRGRRPGSEGLSLRGGGHFISALEEGQFGPGVRSGRDET